MKIDQKLITFMMSNKKKTTYLLISDIKMKIKIFDMSKLKENHFLTYVWKRNKDLQILLCQIGKNGVSSYLLKLKITNFTILN